MDRRRSSTAPRPFSYVILFQIYLLSTDVIRCGEGLWPWFQSRQGAGALTCWRLRAAALIKPRRLQRWCRRAQGASWTTVTDRGGKRSTNGPSPASALNGCGVTVSGASNVLMLSIAAALSVSPIAERASKPGTLVVTSPGLLGSMFVSAQRDRLRVRRVLGPRTR